MMPHVFTLYAMSHEVGDEVIAYELKVSFFMEFHRFRTLFQNYDPYIFPFYQIKGDNRTWLCAQIKMNLLSSRDRNTKVYLKCINTVVVSLSIC